MLPMFQKVGNRKIVSDEGYAVELVGRHDLIYQEGSKSLKFYVESWKPKADILLDTSGAQDALAGEESLNPLAKEEMQRIVSNIIAALGHMDLTVCVHGYPADRGKSAAGLSTRFVFKSLHGSSIRRAIASTSLRGENERSRIESSSNSAT